MSSGKDTKLSPDMDNRDPNELNTHIKTRFEDVIGEPDGIRSMDCVWVNSFKCFECSKNVCYRLLTTLCGLCIALQWGCEFAVTSFAHVWCLTPCLRDFSITVGCWRRLFSVIIGCCLNPVCEAYGMVFSRINIRKE